MSIPKPRLSFWQIINMNFGFFGLQYSFGLQQANMEPIYKHLGADEGKMAFLWMAGPMTGLIVQPIIGAMSDKTLSRWGRRTPYFLIGAVFCSLALLAMPYSPEVWIAASILWILDAANNVTQEPYRAFVSDKLLKEQHSIGFLTQSAFTGLGQTLAYLTPTLLVWFGMNKDGMNSHNIPYTTITAFMIGAVFSIGSILWTLKTTKEHPLSTDEIAEIKKIPKGFSHVFAEIATAIKEMPLTMKLMFPMKFFSWYAMFCYWQKITSSLASSVYNTTDDKSPGFQSADLLKGQIGATYNFIAFFSAFGLAMLAQRYGPKWIHSICLALAGIGLLWLPRIHDETTVFMPMIGMGLCWASMMGNPYIMLAGSIPPARTGVYMGIFNMFIVIPMLIQTWTFDWVYIHLLNGSPENAIGFAGVLLLLASVSVFLIKLRKPVAGTEQLAIRAVGH
jgi:maltose/moltooligosaccharide transporter